MLPVLGEGGWLTRNFAIAPIRVALVDPVPGRRPEVLVLKGPAIAMEPPQTNIRLTPVIPPWW